MNHTCTVLIFQILINSYYQGQFYAVDCFGNVLVCDIEDLKQAKTRIVVSAMPTGLIRPRIQKLYLVELGGTLFVIARTSNCLGYRRVSVEFRAFEVPFGNGNWLDSEVKTLGNRSLFQVPILLSQSTSQSTLDARPILYTSLVTFMRHAGTWVFLI